MTAPDELRAKAEAATPGPWSQCGHKRGGCVCRLIYGPDDVVAKAYSVAENDGEGYTEAKAKQNAAYIAAANPARIIALLDERDALLTEVARLKAEREWTRQALITYFENCDFDHIVHTICGRNTDKRRHNEA